MRKLNDKRVWEMMWINKYPYYSIVAIIMLLITLIPSVFGAFNLYDPIGCICYYSIFFGILLGTSVFAWHTCSVSVTQQIADETKYGKK